MYILILVITTSCIKLNKIQFSINKSIISGELFIGSTIHWTDVNLFSFTQEYISTSGIYFVNLIIIYMVEYICSIQKLFWDLFYFFLPLEKKLPKNILVPVKSQFFPQMKKKFRLQISYSYQVQTPGIFFHLPITIMFFQRCEEQFCP